MTEAMLKIMKLFFATAINEASAKIKPDAPAQFYCEALGEFTGADGRVYVAEVTVRPVND